MSETRARTAKRGLAAERTASPRPATRITSRRTRRRISSGEEAITESSTAASGAFEPESEEDTQQVDVNEEKKSESETHSSSSSVSTPVRMTGFEAGARTPEADADAFSVISGDASPQGNVFDFLSFSHTDPAPFSLFTPSPGFSKMTTASSPPTRRITSALSSPSRFFRSPFNVTGAKKKQTRKNAHRRHSLAESEEKQGLEARLSVSSSHGSMSEATVIEGGVEIKEEIIEIDDAGNDADFKLRTPARKTTSASVKEEIPQMLDMMSLTCSESLLSPWPRSTLFANTPSPPSRVQILSRRLKEDFDRERGTGDGDDASDAESSIDADDLYRSAPSGLTGASGEQDSFFSFANSLSPLVHPEEFESSFLSVRLSPLVSMESYELPRLIPPFPMPKLDDEGSAEVIEKMRKASFNFSGRSPSSSTLTPKTPMFRRASISSYSSGSSRSSGSASSSILSESFPNIQASTSATPGKDERSKIGTHSIMKMKLHVPLEPSTLSHSKREIEAINNSLRKKNRKRKLDEKRSLFNDEVAPVQRKLLQTPLKSSPSRSPHHPWNGRIPRQEVASHQAMALATTPRKMEQGASYSVLSTQANSTPSSSRQSLNTSTPVSSALMMTPSSNWKKSKSVPPSGLSSATAAGSGSTPLTSSLGSGALRLKQTPLRHSVNISSALPIAFETPIGVKQLVPETPMKTPGHTGVKASQAPGSAISPMDEAGMTTPAPANRTAGAHDNVALTTPAMPKKAPCNCKKSKCLKLYCECFASGGYCDENCNCQGCANTPATEAIRQQAIAARLEKNPNAFKPKIESTTVLSAGPGMLTPSGARVLTGTPTVGAGAFATPIGAGKLGFGQRSTGADLKKMHKHGCHCKKSACQKKYCECFQAGVPCGDNCRCIDCKNQAPCASHASSGSLSANATPSHLLNDVEDSFVSPVLHNVRHRLRIDRETWTKNFSSPFEVSPRRERERNERFRSQLRANTTVHVVNAPGRQLSASKPSGLSFRLKPPVSTPDSASAAFMTPTASGLKRQKLSSVSPMSESTPQAASTVVRGGRNGKSPYSQSKSVRSSVEKQPQQQQRVNLLTPSSTSRTSDRVFLYPLFGGELPPVKSVVSAKIFHFLTNADLYNASLVSKLWSQVALGDAVWDHANFLKVTSAPDGKEEAEEWEISQQPLLLLQEQV